MDTSYLENVLPFAKRACNGFASLWMQFAMTLGGEMAQDSADRIMGRYLEYDVPLIMGLENELAKRHGEDPPHDDIGGGISYEESAGYAAMPIFFAAHQGEEVFQ